MGDMIGILFFLSIVSIVIYGLFISPRRRFPYTGRRHSTDDLILCAEHYLIEAQAMGDVREEQLMNDRLIVLREQSERDRLTRVMLMTDNTAHNRYGVR